MVFFPIGKVQTITDETTPARGDSQNPALKYTISIISGPQGTRGIQGAGTSDPYAPVNRSIVFKHSSQLSLLAASAIPGYVGKYLHNTGLIDPNLTSVGLHGQHEISRKELFLF